jgi:chemotaxis protein methyltransferase CheR
MKILDEEAVLSTLTANQEEFNLFKRYIEQQCSIALTEDKKYLLESRLTRLVVESGCNTFLDFYKQITTSPSISVRDKIIDAITTNETLWFRDNAPWIAIKERVIPELADRIRNGKIRIWSAACSTGQEPYSLCMTIDDFCRNSGGRVTPQRFEVTATDISTSALFIAMAGRYDRISMSRGFTDEWAPFKDRYFTASGPVSVIKDEIKNMVTFKRFNLQDSFSALGNFDVVFIRNVAIYFSETFKIDLYKRLQRAMNHSGFLFIGSSETLMGYSDSFESAQHGRAMYYRNGR